MRHPLFMLASTLILTGFSTCKKNSDPPQGSACPAQLTAGATGSKDLTAHTKADSGPTVPMPASGEGMWPWHDISKLDEQALKRRGLKIPLKSLWTPGKGGLARAVIGLRGCTGSFIGTRGLIITNHHCAFRAIQRNSTATDNLLEKGFIAADRKSERNGFGTVVWVFLTQRDVTREILDKIPPDCKDEDRAQFIEDKEKALVKKCEATPNRMCRVSRENHGLRFLLLENLEIRDVRLVAAPPRAMGEFGGEVDNWRWPRHTLDFALLRAYVGKDGSVQDY
ncbi:S46 family peptidase, partial [Myxococcota bacterium]|nr:S46 family peptidase [Myxococcota bacterium]